MKLILPSFILLAASLASVSEAIKISGGREIADAQAPKQFPSFCDRYRQACIQVVLDGTTSVGDRQIIYKCRKNKNHTTYSFGCKNGKGKDFTKKALRRISDTGLSSTVASTFSTTTTATTSTETETSTTPTVVNETAFETVEEVTTQTLSSTQTLQTAVASLTTESETEYTSTVVLTTVGTSITEVLVPFTSTIQEVATSTQVVSADLVTEDYVITMPNNRRAVRLDNSRFCKAYGTACGRQCARVGSTPRHQVCRAKAGNRYSLSCVCKNGQLETQHALNDAGNDVDIVVASTLATATSTILETKTTVVPSTAVITGTSTLTNTVTQPTTVVSTTISTSTLTVPITQTLSTQTLTTATVPSTSLVPNQVASTTTTSTTILVAATGVLRVELESDNSLVGYVGESRPYPLEQSPNRAVADATNFMAIRDPATKLVQLQPLDGPFVGQAFCAGNPTLTETAIGHKWMQWCTPDAQPGPAQGSSRLGMIYETWFTKVRKVGGRFELLSFWMQPDRSIVQGIWDDNSSSDVYYMEASNGVRPLKMYLVDRVPVV